jgi:hypothetical protein
MGETLPRLVTEPQNCGGAALVTAPAMTGRPAGGHGGGTVAVAETSAAQADPAGPADPVTVPRGFSPRPWQQHYFWLITALVALAALVVGGSVEHAIDKRHAVRAFYATQLTSTEFRFWDEEGRQIALPVARRSVGPFFNFGDSIGQDLGINPDSTLDVELGTGSVESLTQIVFAVTVSSPYASTTVVLWTVRGPGAAGNDDDQNVGGCLLTSTLDGPGRAHAEIHFGNMFLEPCTPDLWRPSPASAVQPDLTRAGIPTTGRP